MNRNTRKRLLALGMTVMLGGAQISTVQADLYSDLENTQIQQYQTSQALNSTQNDIDELEYKKYQITGEINTLDAELVVTLAVIDSLNTEITNKQAEIEVTEANLAQAEQEEEDQYQLMKKRIQFLYESGGSSSSGWLSLILDGESISEILNQAEYTQKLYTYDRQCLEEYMETVQQVSDYKDQLSEEKAELEVSKSEQEEQEAVLEDLLAEKRATCADYSNQIDNLESMAAQYASIIAQQNEKIRQLQADIAAAEEAARQEAARQEAARQEAARQQAAAEEAARQQAAAEEAARQQQAQQQQQQAQQQQTQQSTTTTSAPVQQTQTTTSYSGTASGSAVVSYACQFVGNPYVWGGTSLTNGADCSGFIQSVYRHFGISIPRTSREQRSCGYGVSYSEMQAGDIICYDGHVAMYMGDGRIVHASNERDGIKISNNPAYRTILAIRRVL